MFHQRAKPKTVEELVRHEEMILKIIYEHGVHETAPFGDAYRITCAFDAAGLDAARTLTGYAHPKTTRRDYARVQKGRVLRNLAGVLDLEAVRAYAGKGDAV